MKLLSNGFAFVVLLLLGACQPGGVGDPCDPVSCPSPTDPTAEEWRRCDWLKTEIYLEGRSLQCRTRVCMVFRVDYQYQDPSNPGVYQGPYCTRPCGEGATYPDCPADYCCMKIITAGTSSATGTYCVKKSDLVVGDTIARDDCDLISECCTEGSVVGTVDCGPPGECNQTP
jgi:hypothetical protein